MTRGGYLGGGSVIRLHSPTHGSDILWKNPKVDVNEVAPNGDLVYLARLLIATRQLKLRMRVLTEIERGKLHRLLNRLSRMVTSKTISTQENNLRKEMKRLGVEKVYKDTLNKAEIIIQNFER